MAQARWKPGTLFLPLLGALAALLGVACGASSKPAVGQSTASSRVNGSSPPRSPSPPVTGPLLPSDLTLLTVVTKERSLPSGYMPSDLVPVSSEYNSSLEAQRLRRPAAEALMQMLSDARRDGLTIKVNSGFRSFDYQAAVLRAEIAAYGCALAQQQVAAPGHSEHQLGLAADLTSADVAWDLSDSFGTAREGRWLVSRAAAYGFVLSYPEGKEGVTGYRYEPWHFRFVTVAVAQAIVASGKTPAEYLMGLGAPEAALTQSGAPGVLPAAGECG